MAANFGGVWLGYRLTWASHPQGRSCRICPLSWLRAFKAAARHLSFTQAAEELLLTQAAISKQVKLLEHHPHEPLFERRPRSLVLTKVGPAHKPKVQDAFDRLAAGTQKVFGNRRTQVLTLRTPIGFAVNWLATRLPRFLDAHPKVPLRLVSSVWSEKDAQYNLDTRLGMGR